MNNKEGFQIKIMKKKPKKNPVTYNLKTISEIFDILNEKNVSKFMREFKIGMQTSIAMRTAVYEVAKAQGNEVPVNAIQMTSFTWIDD